MGEFNQEQIKIICGPTASGKTSLALELAEQTKIEIISADSRQIIKYLDIGTAKPTPEERKKVKFHLIDIIEPGERYSAFKFINDANSAIESILQKKLQPVVVGGTGLYLRALTEGVVEIEEKDFVIREKLEKEMEELGGDKMHERLMSIDPLEAAHLHPNNKVRIIRALEIYYLTGKSKSELAVTGAYRKSKYNFQYLCLMPDRKELYDIINQRVDMMMEKGLLGELETLIGRGLEDAVRRANVIGYAELLKYLDNSISLDEAVSQIKQNSRRYAKRQMTWFRHRENIIICQNRSDLSKLLVET